MCTIYIILYFYTSEIENLSFCTHANFFKILKKITVATAMQQTQKP